MDGAVSSLHINADDVFVLAKIRQSITMYRNQIKRDIFATKLKVKLLVGRFLSVRVDILFYAGEDFVIAHYQWLRGGKNGELTVRNSETDIIVIPGVIMSVNVDQQCRANVSSRKTSDELQTCFTTNRATLLFPTLRPSLFK